MQVPNGRQQGEADWLTTRMCAARRAVTIAVLAFPLAISAQIQQGGVVTEDFQESAEDVEEIVVTGTQIKGAAISESLSISVLDGDEIDLLGPSSGDELLTLFPAHGQNFFSQAEDISGSVNSARGDIGAFNLRNLGTGNTLVLMNGRRMVNASTFQTELIGGSFVPVTTVNSNEIPVLGLDRVEILRDGASAIYGADAVAGVVNNVLKKDLDGLVVQLRHTEYDNTSRTGDTLNLSWGQKSNGGLTKYGLYFSSYSRGRVNSQDDPKWADADYRRLVPEDSPVAADSDLLGRFRRDSAHSQFGQFDVDVSVTSSGVGLSGVITDSSGEFQLYPTGHEDCDWAINDQVCGAIDGDPILRYNLNENRDLSSELARTNFFAYFDHRFDSGLEIFTEFSLYQSSTNHLRHPSSFSSTLNLDVGAQNYYNPLGPSTSPNRLSDAVLGAGHSVPAEGLEMRMDNYRFAEVPRVIDTEAMSFRLLQGVRGSLGDWDWEAALLISQANREDVTHNRISNLLMQEALNDPTPAAYNPFSGGVNSNIERALVDVYRNTESTLTSLDARFSNQALFELPGGPAALLAGAEMRIESFEDDRDPRLDGTIVFTASNGKTYPFVSDVMNSSPTPDNSGDRTTISLFTELQMPLLRSLDMQLALRFEDFSDVSDSALVGKVALGWRIIDQLLLRGSLSQAYRVPNMVTINETIVARENTRDDFVCHYASDNGRLSGESALDCEHRVQRRATGSTALVPEESLNTSFGLVIEPMRNMTIQLDYWRIEKENTIGLFGEENHTLLQLLQLLEHGTDDCSVLPANDHVGRGDVGDLSTEDQGIYRAAGICPVGQIAYVAEQYTNLDTRILAGYDLSFRYRIHASSGRWTIKYNISTLDQYDQEPSSLAQQLVDAQADGRLPSGFPVSGFEDLIGQNGNQDLRQSLTATWRRAPLGASLAYNEIGEFYQTINSDGYRWAIPAMGTLDASFDYTLRSGETTTRFRLSIKNLLDERAPLARGFFGYFADAHTDWGRYLFLDVKFQF